MTSHPSSERIPSLTTGRILEHYNCGTMTRRTGNADIVSERKSASSAPSGEAKIALRRFPRAITW